MTKQEVFDKVSFHLLTQNAKSVARMEIWKNLDTTTCSYRGDGGRMCAIGCLIPDEKYTNIIEGGSVESFRVKAIMYDIGLCEHMEMLIALQYVHDGKKVSEWRSNLKQVAQQYSLNSDCLD